MTTIHQKITDKMAETGIIPVFNHKDIHIAKKVLDISYNAGIRVFEFTNRESNAFEVFKELKIYAEKYEDLILGIGTIFTREDAVKFHMAGADFFVSPALVPEVAHYCNMKSLFWIPGCATLTEVYSAKSLGATFIKAFPGNLLGPAFIRAVLSVMPDLKMMPTGGVEPNKNNLQSWFDSGVVCVGMGSQLFDKNALLKGDYDSLEIRIKDSLKIVQSLKG